MALLRELGPQRSMLGQIFTEAQNKITDPAKLFRLIDMIDSTKWMMLGADVKGDIYGGLLERNAEDTKSGSGQYLTPRTLIRAMVECVRPEPGKTIADPACGTGGFFLATHDFLTDPRSPCGSACVRLDVVLAGTVGGVGPASALGKCHCLTSPVRGDRFGGAGWEPRDEAWKEAAAARRRVPTGWRNREPANPRTREGEMTKSCPQPVHISAFRCHFRGLKPLATLPAEWRILPCISFAWAAIRGFGDVAEWSKALPC